MAKGQSISSAEEVKTIFDQLGMTPNAVAQALEISVQSLHRWLKVGAPFHQMVKLKRLLAQVTSSANSTTLGMAQGSGSFARLDLCLDFTNPDMTVIKRARQWLDMMEKIAKSKKQ